jgi:C4-dicarboxylate transporter DctM subunit
MVREGIWLNQRHWWSIAVTSLGALGGLCVLIVALVVTFDVVMRYFFNKPTEWVLEISIYLVMASAFFGAPLALRDKVHVRVDLLTSRISKDKQALLEVITSVAAMVYCLVLTYEGVVMAFNSYKLGEVSPTTLHVPIFIPQTVIPIGGFLLIVQYLINIKDDVKGYAVLEKDTVKTVIFLGSFLLASVSGFLLLRNADTAFAGLIILLLVFLLSGIPVAFSLGLLGVFSFYLLFGGLPMLMQTSIIAYKVLDDFLVGAIPLFILTSAILLAGGVGSELFSVASKWLQHLPGGLGVATVVTCAIFAAISGSSVATAATIGIVAVPEMLSRGYPKPYVLGTLAAGGTLGILIPPSIPFIIYGSMTDVSVGKLFIAGMVPGIILAGIFILYAVAKIRRGTQMRREAPATWRERFGALRTSFWGLLTPVLIVLGIYSGAFTPTEAAAVSGAYGLMISLFIYRSVKLEQFWNFLLNTAKTSSMILIIMVGAMTLGQAVTMLQVPQKACALIGSLSMPPWTIIVGINILLFVLGMFLEVVSIMLITIPVLFPLVMQLGYDPIWFAVVMVVNMELALITPPVGLNLYVIQGMSGANMQEVLRGVWPYALMMLLFLIAIMVFPPLSTWLPGHMIGG